MKRLLYILCALLLPIVAQAQEDDTRDWATRGIHIREVSVYGQRPMKEIGAQSHPVALRHHIRRCRGTV